MRRLKLLENLNKINLFSKRHLGSSEADINYMLGEVGYDSMSSFIDSVVPGSILKRNAVQIGEERTEEGVLEELKEIASKNKVFKSFIGQGHYDNFTIVILRNVFENPGIPLIHPINRKYLKED